MSEPIIKSAITADELMEIRDRDYRMGQANVAAMVAHFIEEYRLQDRGDCGFRAGQILAKCKRLNSITYVEGAE